MNTVQHYVSRENRFRAAMNGAMGPQLSLDNLKDRLRVARLIDSELSPENLTADGELTPREVQERYDYLVAAARDLMALDKNIFFEEL
jgi:hypothetical protein